MEELIKRLPGMEPIEPPFINKKQLKSYKTSKGHTLEELNQKKLTVCCKEKFFIIYFFL